MKSPLILNFDNSVGDLPGAVIADLGKWQETIRFGCSMKNYRQFCCQLEKELPTRHGTVFLGSGDYHHLSHYLVTRTAKREAPFSFDIVVLDNHPDNMRFPFGIHCGSWVSHIAKLPQVNHVHVLGITSDDISFRRAWENRFRPFFDEKLTYWCMDVDVSWAQAFGLGHAFRRFDSPDELTAAFMAAFEQHVRPVYLSIDKDVLSEKSVRTNWDQGRMEEQHLSQIIGTLKNRLVGSDITGEVSTWTYASKWKNWLSRMDGQNTVSPSDIARWQKEQQTLNLRLLQILNE